jgi:hydroxyacylglutathione hydrolase
MAELFARVMRLCPAESGRIAENVYAVKDGCVNFYIYAKGGRAVCFDAGFRPGKIRRQLEALGIDPAGISHVFLTHSDFDHAAALRVFAGAEVFLSADEEQMVTGRKARMLGIRSGRMKGPYRLLKDGDEVRAGPIRVRAIATPGHTPGSMSYLADDSCLFVGDTFKLIGGMALPMRPYINMDTGRQVESIRKLALLENVKLACTGHRGYTFDYEDAMGEWKTISE